MAGGSPKPEKEIPWCTIFLCAGALYCHYMVLSGNIGFSKSMADVGGSTKGWAHVGLNLSGALHHELDPIVTEVTSKLTGVIEHILSVKENVDDAIHMIGMAVDMQMKLAKAKAAYSLQQTNKTVSVADHDLSLLDPVWMTQTSQQIAHHYKHTGEALPFDCAGTIEKIRDEVKSVSNKAMDKVSELLGKFVEVIKPALNQIGKWLLSFGQKVQSTIDGFSSTLDKVQKMIDQIMAKMADSKGKDKMIFNTFSLFDVDKTGEVTPDNIDTIGKLYGITAMTGDKAKKLNEKYDQDKSGGLSVKEYENFVEDDDIPGAMAVVLRAWSKKLAQVSGNVAAARMRDEVAFAVVNYLSLICAKNMTKLSWVSERLTNASLPMPFTADVLKNLAMDMDNPDKLTTADVGQMVVTELDKQNSDYLSQVVHLLAEPSFFESEGFNMKDQGPVVRQVTKWLMAAKKDNGGSTALIGLLQMEKQEEIRHLNADEISHATILKHIHAEAGVKTKVSLLQTEDEAIDMMPEAAENLVVERARLLATRKRAIRANRRMKLRSSNTSSMLFDTLFGGGDAGSSDDDPDVTRVQNSGVHAVPATLEFAKFLSWNASQTARRFNNYSMDYMGDSSSTLDSFANQIQTMIKKMSGFLTMMMQYSTPRGIEQLENKMLTFGEKAADDVIEVVEKKVLSKLSSSKCGMIDAVAGMIGIQESAEEDSEIAVSDILPIVMNIMDSLQSVLPTVIDDLKFARKEVSAVSNQLFSIFDGLAVSGPPIFDQVSALYKMMWTMFFGLYAFITVAILLYGFYASGWLGGPTADKTEYRAPETFMERVSLCYRSCCNCLADCSDTQACFWACIILFQVVVLLLFIISIVLVLIAGVRTFMVKGCSLIFFLNDHHICGGILETLQKFLETFKAGQDLPIACTKEKLLTCELIAGKLYTSLYTSVIMNLGAAVLSFQLIMQTAVLHEQVRWRRVAHAYSKDED